MKQSLDERNKMIGSAIQLLHGLALATFSAEAARVSFGWGTIGATLAWVFGGVVSCIPGVRSVLVFLTVKCMAPWWAALIAVAVFGLHLGEPGEHGLFDADSNYTSFRLHGVNIRDKNPQRKLFSCASQLSI